MGSLSAFGHVTAFTRISFAKFKDIQFSSALIDLERRIDIYLLKISCLEPMLDMEEHYCVEKCGSVSFGALCRATLLSRSTVTNSNSG